MSNMDIRFSNERAVSSLETDGKTASVTRPDAEDVQLFLDALEEKPLADRQKEMDSQPAFRQQGHATAEGENPSQNTLNNGWEGTGTQKIPFSQEGGRPMLAQSDFPRGMESIPNARMEDYRRAGESPDMVKRHDLESGFLREEKTPKQGQGSGTTQQEAMSLQDMFKGTMNPFEMMFSGKVDAPSQTPPPSLDQGQIEKMVERILVSAPEQGGQEVRLSINSDALRNTEIIIHRDAEGALSVSLSSADHNSFQTLVSSQSGLKQMLEANEKAEVRVSVTEGSQQEQNDSNQRSRGYMQYGPDEQ